MNPDSLLRVFQRSGKIVLLNLDGLTPAQAFWTPAANVNCINWLLGHLIASRSNATRALGQTPVWDAETEARYRDGSAPVSGEGAGVLELMRLLFDFAESQRRLEAGINAATSEALDAPYEHPQFGTVGDYVLYIQSHEMFHAGQIVALRELLGMKSVWA